MIFFLNVPLKQLEPLVKYPIRPIHRIALVDRHTHVHTQTERHRWCKHCWFKSTKPGYSLYSVLYAVEFVHVWVSTYHSFIHTCLYKRPLYFCEKCVAASAYSQNSSCRHTDRQTDTQDNCNNPQAHVQRVNYRKPCCACVSRVNRISIIISRVTMSLTCEAVKYCDPAAMATSQKD